MKVVEVDRVGVCLVDVGVEGDDGVEVVVVFGREVSEGDVVVGVVGEEVGVRVDVGVGGLEEVDGVVVGDGEGGDVEEVGELGEELVGLVEEFGVGERDWGKVLGCEIGVREDGLESVEIDVCDVGEDEDG